MVKFSIIVPVYNVESYIDNCLNSIESQTFRDFEVIIVNDGTQDNSQKIIDKYVHKDYRFKSFLKQNGGLSDARNFGVKKSCGEYLLFVDSDDTINDDLLSSINSEISEDIDIIRFQINKIDMNNSYVEKTRVFKNLSGEEAFIELIDNSWFVVACSAAYKRSYWLENAFEFSVGRLHEDFGLIPFVYINAKKVSVIDYIGYNYYFRLNSIMNDNNLNKIEKKNKDSLYHFDRLLEMINCSNISKRGKKYYKSFIAYTLINRISIINDKKSLRCYLCELKKRRVGMYLIDDTIPRKIKKILFNVIPNLYIKLFVK